jgi:YD repeat-containing protein
VSLPPTSIYVYDALHHTKVLTETAPLGYLTTTFLNAAGQRIRTVDASNRTTSYQYDAHGLLTKATYPDASTELQSYDGAGQVLSRTDTYERALDVQLSEQAFAAARAVVPMLTLRAGPCRSTFA